NKYKHSNEVIIFDEGLVHHLWGIMANSENESFPKDLLTIYEFPNIIVKIDVNEEVLRDRINKRKYNKRHYKILDDYMNEQQKIDKLYKKVISYISNENKIKLEIENYLINLFERKE